MTSESCEENVKLYYTHHVLVERCNIRAHTHSVAELRKWLHTHWWSVGRVFVSSMEPECPVLFGPAQVKRYRVVDLYGRCI